MRRTKIADILKNDLTDSEVIVKGWVRTRRGNKYVNFIALNDGSSINNLQIVADMEKFDEDLIKRITTGAAISVKGNVCKSTGKGQNYEVQAADIEIMGDCDADEYPLQPKKHSLEFLRDIAHLRFRTNTFGAITRVRHAMIFAVHNFFTQKGFYNIHTPIITASDAEGAGEMFKVTTLDINNTPKTEEGQVDYTKDFFGKSTNLTVSGQLEGELAALAMSEIYTFGPTFRAENSNTARHLAEFWMIEPEMAFYDLNDNMDLAEEFTKYLIKYALDNCKEDLEFLSKRQQDEEKNKKADERSMELIEKLNFVLKNDYQRLTYTEAIEILMNSKPQKKGKFQYPIEGFGSDLQARRPHHIQLPQAPLLLNEHYQVLPRALHHSTTYGHPLLFLLLKQVRLRE